jgi:hypothetical protein
MPINAAQLAAGANTQMMSYAANDPIDQVNTDKPFMKWLLANKQESIFGNGVFNEKVRISNDSNYQNYTGDDQVTYNRKDVVRLAPFQHYEAHDGFGLNETELANNGIILTDDREAVPTDAEKVQIVNLIKTNRMALKDGFQENWDLEVHRDGSQSAKAVPGLDLLVSTTPAVGTIGGIDASTSLYWRNNADLNINTGTAGTLTSEMEKMWRACTTYGGLIPDFIVCGAAFYDAYRKDANQTQNRQVIVTGKQGVDADASTDNVYFKGKLVVWDPSFEKLDAILGAITYPWTKRCYFLNSKTLKLRPFKGRWMIDRTPARMYDRYTHYFGVTADYGLTINKRNANAVLSIA